MSAREQHRMSNKNGPHAAAYRRWCSMRRRCNNQADKAYKNYGGRGIKVCERWSLFTNFLADMGDPPPCKSIERKDNNKGYSKSNCAWATKWEQALNKRNTQWITFEGETLCVAHWAKRIGVKRLTLAARLEDGWSVRDALTTPAVYGYNGADARKLNYAGASRTIREWAAHTGIGFDTLRNRLRRGWTVERALSTLEDARFK